MCVSARLLVVVRTTPDTPFDLGFGKLLYSGSKGSAFSWLNVEALYEASDGANSSHALKVAIRLLQRFARAYCILLLIGALGLEVA